MMKTPEQLKGAIRNLAKKKGILCSYPFLFDDRRVMKDLLAEP